MKFLLMVAMLAVSSAYGALVYDDNQEHTIDFSTEDWVEVLNNTKLNVFDGADIHLGLTDNAIGYIEGGEIRGLSMWGTSTAFITGGNFCYQRDYIFAGESVAQIKGGLFWSYEEGVLSADTKVEQNATVIFYGSDFTYETVDRSPSINTYYYINGILESGDVLDNFRLSVGPDATVLFVPEPCSMILLGAGAVLIRRRRAAGKSSGKL